MNRSFGILAATAIALGSFGASAALAQPTTLRVGVLGNSPFGAPPPVDGYCRDLMTAIAAATGYQFTYVERTVENMLPGLVNNETDIGCGPLGATNQRRDMGVAFTSGIFLNNEALLVPVADTAGYRSMADLVGMAVGIVAGATYGPMLNSAGVTDVRGYPTTADALAAMALGEIRAVIASGPGFSYRHNVLGQNPEVRIVDTYVSVAVTYPGLTVRNTDTELLGVLQAALEALKADGTVAALIDKWALPAPLF